MSNAETVRELNDQFRTTLKGGRLILTKGIIDREDANAIIRKVQRFDAFTQDNDPHSEHDFGAFDVGRDSIFWKVDYYSKDMMRGSPNPADPSVTTRVLTVMLACEY